MFSSSQPVNRGKNVSYKMLLNKGHILPKSTHGIRETVICLRTKPRLAVKNITLANVTKVYTLHGQDTRRQYCVSHFPQAGSVYNNFHHQKTRKTPTPPKESDRQAERLQTEKAKRQTSRKTVKGEGIETGKGFHEMTTHRRTKRT